MLVRPGHLADSNVFAVLRLLPMDDRDKDVEILALRHRAFDGVKESGSADRPDVTQRYEPLGQRQGGSGRGDRAGAGSCCPRMPELRPLPPAAIRLRMHPAA